MSDTNTTSPGQQLQADTADFAKVWGEGEEQQAAADEPVFERAAAAAEREQQFAAAFVEDTTEGSQEK